MDWDTIMFAVYYTLAVGLMYSPVLCIVISESGCFGCWRTARRSDVERMLDSVADVPYLPLHDQQEAASTGGGGGEDGPLSSAPSSCVICIAEYNRGEGRLLLPGCGHAFHRGCIAQWLIRHGNTTCPICRATAIVFGPPASEKVDAVSTAQDMV